MPTFREDPKIGTKVPLIKTADLNDKSVTEKKLADGSITKDKIATGAVTSEKLQHNAVTTETINDRAVTAEKIAEGAVSVDEIKDLAVVESKIKNKAVTNVKIDDAAVDTRTIEDKSVTNAKIADGSITQEKIFNSSVTTEKIANESVSAEKLQSGLRSTIVSTHDKAIELDKKKANITDVDYALECLENKIGDRVVVEGNVTNLPDDEDLTSVSTIDGREVMKLNDRAYEPSNFSGKGYKILRKNIQRLNLPTVTILVSNIPSSSGDITITINGKTTTIALDVATDTTTAIIATKIGTALKSSLDDYDVSVSSNRITLTRHNGSSVSPSSINVGNTSAVITVTDGVNKNVRKNVLTDDMINDPNTVYEIRYDFDLNGETITFKEGCVLKFDGGSLANGTIIGNNTLIKALLRRIFSQIKISGDWDVPNIYSCWFDFCEDTDVDNIRNFTNLSALCNENINNVTIEGLDIYISEQLYINSFVVKKNTNIFLNSKIRLLPNKSINKTSVFYIKNVENVSIKGNGSIIGNIESHTNTSEEFSFGIYLIGAKNVEINGISIIDFWGDGIDIQSLYSDYENSTVTGHCYNIIIDNVLIDGNRRNGISVEGAFHVTIKNSRIINTGYKNGTLPMAGIDIEPWYDKEHVEDVCIENNIFNNNKKLDFFISTNKKNLDSEAVKTFKIVNNTLESMKLNHSVGTIVRSNKISSAFDINSAKDLYIVSNDINGTVYIEATASLNNKIRNNIMTVKKSLTIICSLLDSNQIEVEGKILLFSILNNSSIIVNNVIKQHYNADTKGIVLENVTSTWSNNEIITDSSIYIKYKGYNEFVQNTFKSYTSKASNAFIYVESAHNSNLEADCLVKNTRKFANRKTCENYSIDAVIKVFNDEYVGDSILGDTKSRPLLKSYNKGFQYYDLSLKRPIWWNGTIWVDESGNPADSKKQGTTSERPSSVQIGYIYKDTTLNKFIIWNGTEWTNMDGTTLS